MADRWRDYRNRLDRAPLVVSAGIAWVITAAVILATGGTLGSALFIGAGSAAGVVWGAAIRRGRAREKQQSPEPPS
jgi:hypothetical protein